QRQNDVLTGLLQLQNAFEYKTVAAEVISHESSEFRRVVTISKGSDDGIAAGDVVIAEGGALAGRVVELGPNFAKVVLITDQSSTVIGQLQSSLATGEVVGTLEETLQMKNVDSTEGIELGEEVTTAGIELAGGIRSPYPKGLPPAPGRAVPRGPPAGQGDRRPARREQPRPDRLPAARGQPPEARGRARRPRLPGWPAGGRRRADRLLDHRTRRRGPRRRATVHPAIALAVAVRPDPEALGRAARTVTARAVTVRLV